MKDNNEYPEKVVKTAIEILDSKEGFRGAKHIHHYLVTLEAMEEYANQFKQPANNDYAVKVIQERIVKLEKLQSEFKPTNNTYQELGYIIIELKGIIQVLLTPNN